MIPTGKRNGVAIVMGSNDTALNTARCLSESGIDVRLLYTSNDGLGRYTRVARAVNLVRFGSDMDRYTEWIADYAARLGNRPVLIPCGDADAIAVSRYRDRLESSCRVWSNPLNDLLAIVSKDQLTSRARQLGIAVPATITAPARGDLLVWMKAHAPPYFVKPFYLGVEGSDFMGKNRIIGSSQELLDFMETTAERSLIVQQLVHGGDGWVYDCYGLCRRDHEIVAFATHKRIRQQPPDRGVTCYGEIPAALPNNRDQRILDLTRKLLAGLPYHGIFGIEWIEDRESGELSLIDFNARPFITIRHLRDCGLNLPLLAYDELTDGDLSTVPQTPTLTHKYWIDVLADARTFRVLHSRGTISWFEWLRSLAGCRSYAIFSTRDLVPSMMRVFETLTSVVSHGWRRLMHRDTTRLKKNHS